MGKTEKIGLVAGRGNLPYVALEEIHRRNAGAVVVGVAGEAGRELAERADSYQELPAGNLGGIIDYFKSQRVTELVMAGKVGKEALFRGGFDPVVMRLLQKLPEKNDDAILLAIVNEFETNGLHVAKQTDYLRALLAEPGPITGTLSETELEDVRLGFRVAKAMGGLDIGQSVVVKQGVVLAVEAIEGTDQAIRRGGSLGGPGSVVVKVSKPQQDERFDVPTVGKTTIESMIAAGSGVLGIEARKTLVTEQEALMELAVRHRLKIIAISADELQLG